MARRFIAGEKASPHHNCGDGDICLFPQGKVSFRQEKSMRKHILPVLTLFFLAPIIGELVSGSAPPANWLQPGTYIIMVPLYGAGALLARELAVRWKAGWLGVVLLGAAYGILEEGVDVMSFFNTAWPDLGSSALYGRWADVSWIWTVHLTCYHAAFSIAIPILLTHLVFPGSRGESWLGCLGTSAAGAVLAAVVLVGNLLFRQAFNYTPPTLPYCGSILVIALLVLAARRIRAPRPVPGLETKPLPAPWLYGAAGFVSTTVFFLAAWSMPDTGAAPILAVLIILLPAAAVMAILEHSYRHGPLFTDSRKLALAAGGLAFLSLLTLVTESRGVDPGTGESFAGMACVGMTTILALVVLSVAVRRRGRQTAKPELAENKPTTRDNPRGMFD
jgi:hypothetical protein